MKGLYYYKLVSEYPEDITKNCKLTVNEIDSNFKSLKDEDIKSADFDRENKTLVLTRNNGEKLIVLLDDIPYDLNINANCSDDGVSLSVYYDGKNGVKQFKIDHLITLDMLRDKIEELIGTDILTKVITDSTLRGYGTLDSPLGLNGTEKTGMYAPVIARIDLTQGGKLPEVAKLGTRYATIEYVNDYGYLYNGNGVNKIANKIEEEGRGWRVPSKRDWDVLLNLIEPCEYRNHDSARCHVELGKVAGKYLKSVCGWEGQPFCECAPTVPITSCTFSTEVGDEDYVDYDSDGTTPVPSPSTNSYSGVDKYGMSILPTGIVNLDGHGRPQVSYFREKTIMWTDSHVYGDLEQDKYVKAFDWNKGGVVQEADCPAPFYSVRLVKDYDGSNYFDTEYIDGIPYKTILFPEIRQIWLASNYAQKEGFNVAGEDLENPEVAEVNNGEVIEKRKAVFLNEWNGCYWEKKELNEGDTVVVENTCFDVNQGEIVTEVCWLDESGEKHCVEVVIPDVAQFNIEYRVFTTGGTSSQSSCDQDLVNTDYLAIERLLRIIIPLIERERWERIASDEALSGAIETETAERISADTELWDALTEETECRISGDTFLNEKIDSLSAQTEEDITELWEALNAETEARISADTELWDAVDDLNNALDEEISARTQADEELNERIDEEILARTQADKELNERIDEEISARTQADEELNERIDEEIARAKSAEDTISGLTIDTTVDYVLSASMLPSLSEYNLILKSKDGLEEHQVRIKFDGDFGEI